MTPSDRRPHITDTPVKHISIDGDQAVMADHLAQKRLADEASQGPKISHLLNGASQDYNSCCEQSPVNYSASNNQDELARLIVQVQSPDTPQIQSPKDY